MKIVDDVYTIPNVVCNVYVIKDADGLTVIDTGMPGSLKKILTCVAQLGKTPQDVRHILLTHSDLDHVGSLAALQEVTGARTYTSQIEADAIRIGKSSRQLKPRGFSLRRVLFTLMKPFIKATPFSVHEIVREGSELPVLGGLRVLETPGHTPGHLSFYSPSTGVLFCGDSIVTEYGLQVSRPGLTWDQDKAAESLRKQAALGARTLLSGHGPAMLDPVFPPAGVTP